MMVPNLRSAEEAREVVAACRYGPRGIRGAAPGIIRATGYGSGHGVLCPMDGRGISVDRSDRIA